MVVRRPTLDDVFLQLTGHRAEEPDATAGVADAGGPVAADAAGAPPRMSTPRFWASSARVIRARQRRLPTAPGPPTTGSSRPVPCGRRGTP